MGLLSTPNTSEAEPMTRIRENVRGLAIVAVVLVGAIALIAAIAVLAFALLPQLIVLFASS